MKSAAVKAAPPLSAADLSARRQAVLASQAEGRPTAAGADRPAAELAGGGLDVSDADLDAAIRDLRLR